jgi:radical SAM protein with 4Fe4S-binding SPASM domain
MIFSLEGSSPELHDKSRGLAGTWLRATAGIRNGVAARRKSGRGETIINFVVQSFNSGDLYDAAILAEQLGVDSIRFAMVHGYTTTDVFVDDLELLRDSVNKIRAREFNVDIVLSPYIRWLLEGSLDSSSLKNGLPAYNFFKNDPAICMVAYQSCLIDTWGDVYPCTYSYFDNQPVGEHFDGLRKQNVLGNIFDNTFREVWTGDAYSRFRKSHLPVAVEKSPEVCGQCEHYYAFKSIENTVERALNQTDTIEQAMTRVGEEKPCGCFSNEFEFRI